MNIRKKTIVLMPVIAIASFLIGSVLVTKAPEGTIVDYQDQINELKEKVAALESVLELLEDPWIQGPPGPQGETGPQGEPGRFEAPDYDSGWVFTTGWINNRKSFTHNLGTTDLFVFVYGRQVELGSWVYHQKGIGWDTVPSDQGSIVIGMQWLLVDENTVVLLKGYEDSFWDQARILIWAISET